MKYKISYRHNRIHPAYGFAEWTTTNITFSGSSCIKLYRLMGGSRIYIMDRDVREYLRVSSV